MRRRRGWHPREEQYIVENYAVMTIKELVQGLEQLSGRKRTDDSINAKIKRLKADGRIEGGKENEAVTRSLRQRRKNI
jgi:hypothetical protein